MQKPSIFIQQSSTAIIVNIEDHQRFEGLPAHIKQIPIDLTMHYIEGYGYVSKEKLGMVA